MEESLDAILSRLEELSRAVCNLERRTAALERLSGTQPVGDTAPRDEPPVAASVTTTDGVAAIESAASLTPLFGWALMGIAGAYLLRAITETGAIPGYAGVIAGIVYAAWWLFLAARRSGEVPIVSTVHALTAALILVPMLWELTVRFRLISVHAASGVILLFTVLGLLIGWSRNVSSIAWIVTIGGMLTATALFRESHDPVAWTATILAIALAVEASACRDHWLSLRWMAAIAANFSVLMLAWLAAGARSGGQVVHAPSWGALLGAQIALLAIYMASMVNRTLFRRLTITWFEIGQGAAAFLISIGGALNILGTARGGALGVGLFCLAAGAACYLVSFAFLEKSAKQDRNFYTYSTFALLLITAGCRVLLSGAVLAAVWAALATGMMTIGFLRSRNTLRVHAAIYLVMAVATARLLQHATQQVLRSTGEAFSGAPYIVALAGAAGCYAAIVMFGNRKDSHWTDQAEAVVAAALVLWGGAGVTAAMVAGYISAAAPARTALVTACAIAVRWAGARWNRIELSSLAYPLLAFAGIKLVVEDFRQGQPLPLVLSLIFFGGGLIVMPRLARRQRFSRG